MQADMDDVVHMKLEGTMAELLVKIDLGWLIQEARSS